MPLHESTFEYLRPSDKQLEDMGIVREAAAKYAKVIDAHLPEGSDKTYLMRAHRSNAMWANVSITRHPDGSPR